MFKVMKQKKKKILSIEETMCKQIIVFLQNIFPKKYTLEDFHIVLDCANGATYGVAPHVFEELGAKVTPLAVNPDGKNINHYLF